MIARALRYAWKRQQQWRWKSLRYSLVLGVLGRSPTYAVFDISEYWIGGRTWHKLIGNGWGPRAFRMLVLFWPRS